MHQTLRKQTTSLLICIATCVACDGEVEAPHVDFGVSQPIGRWEPESAQSRFGDASVEIVPQAERGASGGAAPASSSTTGASTGRGPTGAPVQNGASTPSTGAAGRESTMSPSAAEGGKGGSNAMQAAAGSAADSGNEPAPEGSGVTSLTFNFSTEPVGGRYKPKNIGAVWISDSSGKLVKSLEVWARIRLRYLTKYAGVRGSARPDVTATATLPNHNLAHMVMWDLKDTKGAAVPPGKYTLNAEITDQDATGKNISVEVDTSAGPMTLMPPASTGFTKLELVLK